MSFRRARLPAPRHTRTRRRGRGARPGGVAQRRGPAAGPCRSWAAATKISTAGPQSGRHWQAHSPAATHLGKRVPVLPMQEPARFVTAPLTHLPSPSPSRSGGWPGRAPARHHRRPGPPFRRGRRFGKRGGGARRRRARPGWRRRRGTGEAALADAPRSGAVRRGAAQRSRAREQPDLLLIYFMRRRKRRSFASVRRERGW